MVLSGYYRVICCLLLAFHTLGELLINPVPHTYQLYENDFLMKVWYTRISATAAAPDGATDVNHRWEEKEKNVTEWFIELQRYGCDDVTAAIYANRTDLLSNGENIFNWGFSRQTSDGGFNNNSDCIPPMQGTGDPFHSTSLFIEAVSRCMILMRQSPNFLAYQSYFHSIVFKLVRAARWLLEPSVLSKGIAHNMPYTHRRYLLAAALGQIALLTNNLTLQEKFYKQAAAFAEDGISRQNSTGFNPEVGGYDSSYNAVGLFYACNYLVVCPDANLQEKLANMLSKSFAWQLTRINSNGSANLTGNTRVTGNNKTDEKDRGGYDKNYAYTTTINVLELGSVLLQNETLHQEAQLVATYKGYFHEQLKEKLHWFLPRKLTLI